MSGTDGRDGTYFGNYRLTAEIGSGGFGKVYRGEHTILTERAVAIKLLHAHLSTPEDRERFLQEARMLEHLKHPNILHIFDVGIYEGFPYLVAEYAPQGSLRDLIKRYAPNPLPTALAINILTQVGQALYYAHHQNVVHRDLKPENILFNAEGNALLADFGIATTLSTSSIKQVNITGSPSYMAPEQFQSSVSKESDQYALGCIAYELFTGRVPFEATDFFSMGFSHLTKLPTEPTQLNPSLPLSIEQTILKAMAKERHDRHADIRAFVIGLHTSGDAQFSTNMLSAIFLPDRTTNSIPTPGEQLTQIPPKYATNNLPIPPAALQQASNETIPDQSYKNSRSGGFPSAANVSNGHNGYQQFPETPIPPLHSNGQAGNENFTLLPFSNPSSATQVAYGQPFSTGPSAYQQTPFNTPPPLAYNPGPYYQNVLPSAAYPTKQRNNKQRGILIAVTSLIILASLFSIIFFAMRPRFTPSTSDLTYGATTTSTQSPLATRGTTKKHTVLTTKPGATPTQAQGVTTTPTNNGTTTTTTQSTTTTQGTTATPGVTPTPTLGTTPTTAPSPTPTTTPITETVTAYFTAGENAATTAHSYSGLVTIQVSGVGQASQQQYSDALYRYTDSSGNTINNPGHPSCWVLYINDKPVEDSTSNGHIPAYSTGHYYSFTIYAPGGTLSFGVCDNVYTDNTGYYTITVTQG